MRNTIIIFILLVILVGGYFAVRVTKSVETKTGQPIEKVERVTTTESESYKIQNESTEIIPAETTNDSEGVVVAELATSVTPVAVKASFDTTKILLGDGKISTSPRQGYVYSCQTQFSAQKAGAAHTGDWVDGDTWDLSKKLTVQGNVSWTKAWFKTIISGVKRLLTGNGLPVGSPTGTYPIATTDPAYQIDRNPNAISAQDVNYSLPSNPVIASEASCVPMGAIGVMLNGTALFNALDAGGRDAVAHEVQDTCNGHPESTGEYHYHGPSDCVAGAEEPNKLIGYALDGFGIFSRFDERGNEYTNADLDACHGTTSVIEWNGKTVEMYHYVITQEYPYTVGCFRGTPVTSTKKPGTNTPMQTQTAPAGAQTGSTEGGSGTGSPPAEAIAACDGKTNGSVCSIQTPQGAKSGTCKTPPNQNQLACIP